MLKKRYVKRIYIEEAIFDKCGSRMEHTGIVLNSWPAQYPYNCINPSCDGHKTFWGENRPGTLKYEYEDEE
jgi:hypothetical protein